MNEDDIPMGPNECPNCPGRWHWPWQCDNTPKKKEAREKEKVAFVAHLKAEARLNRF